MEFMESVRGILALTIAGVLLSMPTAAPSANTCVELPPLRPIHRIFGVVLFTSGDRISNANVTALQGDKEIAAQRSDNDGKFSFEGLMAGNYEMRVRVGGIGAVHTKIVLIRPEAKSKRELAVTMTLNGVCSWISLVNPKRLK
jgi:hypothetical protein